MEIVETFVRGNGLKGFRESSRKHITFYSNALKMICV